MAPISVSVLQEMFRLRGFSNIEKILKLLPGEEVRPTNKEEKEFFEANQQVRSKKILVYFLGGVTFAEIAAIRFLNTSNVL